MRNFIRVTFLTSCLLSAVSFSKPVVVRIDAPKQLIAYHIPTLLFGLRYANGTIVGSNLFSETDLRNGISEKIIQIDETQRIENCEYELLVWAGSVPGTQPDPILGNINMPLGFNGRIHEKCNVDLAKSEIVLSLLPFKLQKLEVSVPSNSMVNRKANAVVGIVTPRGDGTDKYRNFSIQANEKTVLPLSKTTYLLARESLRYHLQTVWILKTGGNEKEDREYADNFIEVK